MMKKYFITGTGTGVGKTLVTSSLAKQLRAKGKTVRALKPVISGFDAAALAGSDTGQLLLAQGLELSRENAAAVSPWQFAEALSPDMAAEAENRTIDFAALNDFCLRQEGADYLLVEGVGGVMVPLGESFTTLDWMEALQWPVILVAGSYLGSISHTLTTVQALLARGLKLQALIISESEHSPVPLARLQAHLKRFLPEALRLLSVTRLDSSAQLWEDTADITESIL